MIVRPANPADLATLVGFQQAMALESEGRALDEEILSAGISALLNDPLLGRYLVAERDDQPVGCLMLTAEWSDWRCAHWWWIQSVYVTPPARQLGVYRALQAHVESEARAAAGVCGLRLYVEHGNGAARRVYDRLGFVDAGYQMLELALLKPPAPG